MKKLFFLLTLLSGLFIACQNNASNADAAKTTDKTEEAAAPEATAVAYTVNTETSVINWEGYKPGKYGHNGTIKLSGGTINVKDLVPQSGSFDIDVTSLESTDLADKPDKKMKLEGHLKDGDFFEVEKYPSGKFEVTSIEPASGGTDANYTVKGNLTLKDVTKGIEIPAMINMADGELKVTTPEFTINRTEWGVNYGSGVIGTVKDQLIADDVKLSISLVANTQVADAQ
ncbi:MAG: YceI family protein [Bacteroidota bacterium]